MENELGKCEVLLYLFPPREEGLGPGEENLQRLLMAGDRAGTSDDLMSFINIFIASASQALKLTESLP